MGRTEMVEYAQCDTLREFVTRASKELNKKVLAQHPARLEILTADRDKDWELSAQGVTALLWDESDENTPILTHIFTCSYRGLFGEEVFEATEVVQSAYAELRAWIGRGKLKELLRIYLSGTAKAEFDQAIWRLRKMHTQMLEEDASAIEQLQILTTRKADEVMLCEIDSKVDEHRFANASERVREKLVKAKLCVFCLLLEEVLSINT